VISVILSFDWALAFFWIMATTLGWFLGELIPGGLSFAVAGLLIGVFQSLVLQGRIGGTWRWMVSTFSSWTLAYFIFFFWLPREMDILDGAILGLAVGIAQWLILRRELRWAGWWIIFSVMGWVTGLTLLPGALLTGTMAGALTGLALEILLRHPRPGTIGDRSSGPRRV
jgi:hypothetical protein